MKNPAASLLQVGRTCRLRVKDHVFDVEILGLSREMIWVSCPSSNGLEEGAGVELEFRDGERFAGYHARVVVLPATPGNGVMLRRSESATYRAQRSDWRVPTDFSVYIRRDGTDEKFAGRMLDLTQNGSLVATTGEFEVGDDVEMFFQLPGFAAHRLFAKIVYSDKSAPSGPSHFGLRFTKVGRESRETIVWYLYDRIWELYAEELRELYPPSVSKRNKASKRVAMKSA